MATINKYTFTATTVAANILTTNLSRRRLYIASYGPPDNSDGITVWIDWSGAAATVQGCFQLLPGAVWIFGNGNDDYIAPLQTRYPDCPTGAISVITGSSTHQGVIYEWT